MMRKFNKWAVRNKVPADILLSFVSFGLVLVSAFLLQEAEKEDIGLVAKVVSKINAM